MRIALTSFALLHGLALAQPDFVADFQPAVLEEVPAQVNQTAISENNPNELFKRQGTNCANGYAVCTNINRPDLCCRTTEVCSIDHAGNAACCPKNAACTGTIGVVTGPTSSVSVSSTTAPGIVTPVTTTTGAGTTSTTDNPFIQSTSGATPAHSTVSNSYFPFPIIPTTYTNAAGCSSAYTSCQSDAASCTAALASGQNGVTVSAPNGGVTVTAITSLGQQSAASICSSLSLAACSGLKVEACQAFGTGAGGMAARPTGCAGMYGVAGGVALGIAGQLLR